MKNPAARGRQDQVTKSNKTSNTAALPPRQQIAASLAGPAGLFRLRPPDVDPVTEQPAPTGHIYGRKDFTWSKHADGWALHAIGHRNAIVHVVPDGVWPGMWRIRHPGGQLSDMANLTWAKDGAIAVAMRLLDPRRRIEQPANGGPSMRQNGSAATSLHPKTGEATP
jgi:hypothetical protein